MQSCIYIYIYVDTVYTYAHHSSNLDSCGNLCAEVERSGIRTVFSPNGFVLHFPSLVVSHSVS